MPYFGDGSFTHNRISGTFIQIKCTHITQLFNILVNMLAQRPYTGCWRVSAGSSTIILRSATSSQPNYGSSPYQPLLYPCPVSSGRSKGMAEYMVCRGLPTVTRSNLCPRPRFSRPDPRPYFLGPSLVPR